MEVNKELLAKTKINIEDALKGIENSLLDKISDDSERLQTQALVSFLLSQIDDADESQIEPYLSQLEEEGEEEEDTID